MPSSSASLCSLRRLQSSRPLGDQQHCVRARRPRFQQLIAVQKKVLAQDGGVDLRTDFAQVRQMTLEIVLIGQHAETARSVLLVNLGDLDRLEVGPNQAARRARLLYLRDQFDATIGSQRREEVAYRGGLFDPGVAVVPPAGIAWLGQSLRASWRRSDPGMVGT